MSVSEIQSKTATSEVNMVDETVEEAVKELIDQTKKPGIPSVELSK